MNKAIENPFPLEDTVKRLCISGRLPPADWKCSDITRDFYLKLARPIVKAGTTWQDDQGRIIDPFADKETPTSTARFVGACSGVIQSGNDDDLVESCALSMDKACEDLYSADRIPIAGAEFYTKELMMGYANLKDKVDAKRCARWKTCLSDYDPEKIYGQVLSKCRPEDIHNFCTFAIAGEAFKIQAGLADNIDFIERYIELQKQYFTEFGMYRDPHDPMVYDMVARMNLALMMHWGYRGGHVVFVDEMLRRGALTGLLMTSASGEAPYGGRSNQQNWNEATMALICEYEARRYAGLGDMHLAGAFKRTARLAVKSIEHWLTAEPVRFNKNRFPPQSEHGREKSYGYYGAYSLLIAAQLGLAYMLADDSIPETPAFCEIGGYGLYLPDAFHKIFAACGGYHVEIDTRADLRYDATGLGRIHRAGTPTELGPSMPIAACPNYLVTPSPALRNIAAGPGWIMPDKTTTWLADLSEEITNVEMSGLSASRDEVLWTVVYKVNSSDCLVVREKYRLATNGLEITSIPPESAIQTLVQVPLLETSGSGAARISANDNSFTVDYAGHVLRVECADSAEQYIESFPAPNRNGIYRVGCFRTSARQITWRIKLGRASQGI